MFQLNNVIHYAPLHRCRTAEFHLIHSIQCRKHGLDTFLTVLLYYDRSGGSIQRIGHKRTRSIVVTAPCGNLGIAHPVRKLRPQLPYQRRDLKTCSVYIRMLVKPNTDITAIVVGNGCDILYPVYPRQHPFQTACYFCLYNPGGISGHGEGNGKSGHVMRWREFYRKQRHKCKPYKRQTHECHNESK